MSPAGIARAILAQTGAEIRFTLRRGESVLVTIVIPLALLAFFAASKILPGNGHSIDFLLPGTLALAVISTGLVSLSIATGYERYYGVLKRYGSTPFPRAGLIAAKILAVAVLEAVQVALLVAVAALFFGWRPHGSPILAILVLLLGTAAFAGLGLAMAGRLRAEATLALANGLFLFFLLLGGLFVPLSRLPGAVSDVARYLPSASLSSQLREILGHGRFSAIDLVVLLVWAVAGPLLAALTFRWE